jgi:hypothetical protein
MEDQSWEGHYVLFVTIEDELLQRIKNVKTPKEAWDTLAV